MPWCKLNNNLKAAESEEIRTADFDYELPQELIAQYPARERDASRIARRLAKQKGGSGGGHQRTSAGRIDISELPPEKRVQACNNTIQRFLSILGRESVPGRPIDGFDRTENQKDEAGKSGKSF